jgi:hypothetical protein
MAILGHPPVFIQTLIDILGEIFPHIPTLHMHLKMCEWLISTFPVSLLQSSILSILHFLLGKLCQIMSKHVTSLFWWLTQPISDVKITLFEITGGTFNLRGVSAFEWSRALYLFEETTTGLGEDQQGSPDFVVRTFFFR